MANNHTWLSLVDLSGLLVSEPVLRETFPDGPAPVDDRLMRRFRTEYERWLGTQNRQRWLDFVLRDVLDYGERLYSGMSLPPDVVVNLPEYMQTLRPDAVLIGTDNQRKLLVYIADGELDRPEQATGRWKAAPFTKLDRLLRDTRIPLGLLTNGSEWRLVYAAPGLPTAHMTWNAATWLDERSTLQAFRMLLTDPDGLLKMASDSQQRQADVTDQLGGQVLRAVSLFVSELDRADVATNGTLLSGQQPEQIYEMALIVMMRLVFIFYAEENLLLPHGVVLYDESYGLTYLWNRLEHERHRDPERFAERLDAWPQLLATFCLIYEGCSHPDLIMPAYGGRLFNPARFPALESSDLRINNEAVWRMLRHLTTAESRDGRQRVSYRALEVEQLGYVYERLLGYTVNVAKEPMIQPTSSLDIFPLREFEAALQDNRLAEHLRAVAGLHRTTANNLAETVAQRAALTPDPSPAGRGEQTNWIWEPVADSLIEPGRRYVSFQMGTRKRGGIFYTPPQLTSFLVQQALEPQCYVTAEDGTRKVRSARDILALTMCDPAMGSGAFLVQAVRYLAERLLEAWDAAVSEDNGTKLVMPFAEALGQATEDYGPIPTDRAEARAWARRLVVERCIWGVDLNGLAVELAKLSLWLVTLSKDKPFTFLDHRLRHGNSLIGASFFQETEVEVKKGRVISKGKVRQIAFIPDAALAAPRDATKDEKAEIRERITTNRTAQAAIVSGQMGLFADMTVEEALRKLANRERDLKRPTTSATEYQSKERLLADVLAQGDYPKLKEVADLWCAVWFWPRDYAQHGLPPTTQEYHDTVYAILGLTAIVSTAQHRIEQIRRTARTVARQEHFFQWELEFPDIFVRANPGFDALCGNPPWEIVKPNSQEFFEAFDPNFREYGKQEALHVMEQLMESDSAIAQAWTTYADSHEQQAVYFNSDVPYRYQGDGDLNTYKLFAERFFELLRDSGCFSVLVPSGIYTDMGSKELRQLMLEHGAIRYLFCFSNERFIFPGIHHAFKFTLLGFSKRTPADSFPVAFRINPREAVSIEALPVFIVDRANLIDLPTTIIRRLSPDSLSVMEFRSQRDMDVVTRIYSTYPFIGETIAKTWNLELARELDVSLDSHLFNTSGIGLPIYEGKMLAQFDAFLANPQYWIDEEIGRKRVFERTDYQHPRLVVRRIASNTNERTLIWAITPAMSFCAHSLFAQVGNLLGADTQLFIEGIMNSLVVDFAARLKVSSNVTLFHLQQLPIPRLTSGNPYFDNIILRAVRLTCTRAEFADLWQAVMGAAWDESKGATDPAERQRLRDEIDALVAYLYGLSRDDFEHILHTFPLVFPATAEGQARLESLLRVYDAFAGVTAGWVRQ